MVLTVRFVRNAVEQLLFHNLRETCHICYLKEARNILIIFNSVVQEGSCT